MSLVQDLLEEWRIWFLITALIGAGIAIGPHYESVPREDGSGNTTTIATNINQGLSIQGGARVLIEPDMSGVEPERESAVMDNIITTLKTRVQAFGLQDMTIRPVTGLTGGQQYVRIEMAGADTDQLKELITRQGIFEAGFSMNVQDGDTITLGDSQFTVQASNETVTIDGQTIDTNTTAILQTADNNVTVEYTNRTGSTHRLRAIAFEGADITGVDINPTRSGVSCQSRNSCSFQFQVSVERSAAQRFQSIARNFDEGPQYLQGTQLVLTLDNSQVSSLNVRNVFKNQIVETPTITGGGNSREQAIQEMDELQSTLQSGALPVTIEVVSTNNVSARLGQQFMQVAIIAILAAVVAVGILIFLRYQNPNIAIPIMITGFSEVFILLSVFSRGAITPLVVLALAIPTVIGLAAGFKKKDLKVLMLPFGTGFIIAIMQFAPSLDLAAIAGIIAAVGTGVDDQIIITDERSVKRSLSLKKRLKRAFFIIFTSAASTIGAMLPVMTIGAGAVRGFAITTILGVLIGISITRPAYATILDHVQ
jgi:preprotein translocase subunit SecD